MEEHLRVGVITAPHGIKGEVKVYPTTDDIMRFKDLKDCYLSSGDKRIQARCISCKFLNQMVILGFEGYHTIEQAEQLRQWDILVDREHAVRLQEGEFFLCDIMGAEVCDQYGNAAGIITEVLETPAHQVFVVEKNENGKKKELLIPVVKEWIEEIDVEHKKVKVISYYDTEEV